MEQKREHMNYTLMDHTADFGIEVHAKTLSGLFQKTTLAMFDLICDIKKINGNHKKSITISGNDTEDLMINLLRELLYLWSAKGILVNQIEMEDLSDKKIAATICYDRFNKKQHAIETEIKAVTYHMFEVTNHPDGWFARVVFDV